MAEKKSVNVAKRATIIGVSIFWIITIILGLIAILIKPAAQNLTANSNTTTPELARAMTYGQFEGDFEQTTDANTGEVIAGVEFSAFFLRDPPFSCET